MSGPVPTGYFWECPNCRTPNTAGSQLCRACGQAAPVALRPAPSESAAPPTPASGVASSAAATPPTSPPPIDDGYQHIDVAPPSAQVPGAPLEVRTYSAKSQEKASEMYAVDAATLAAQGLFPTQQIWTAPRYWRLVLTPLVLIGVGWLIVGIYGAAIGAAIGIVYILLVRPKGTMTVTYTRQQPYLQQPIPPQGLPPQPLR